MAKTHIGNNETSKKALTSFLHNPAGRKKEKNAKNITNSAIADKAHTVPSETETGHTNAPSPEAIASDGAASSMYKVTIKPQTSALILEESRRINIIFESPHHL
ncbi:protein of unknown function [Maridesulfovibrio hydrothermalis AM13 = DSM 14728]|uniref:Uncharacterized protein n=1 Tax=Maridesulfovibrio hydrothermalis AM13 = DSM 14728 TaxID=1121451 RepID=L0RDP9_9BACT|nr:protein of unknown function [Maridesulfovibrio hydrothermalis AM13 = DSM 14728]